MCYSCEWLIERDWYIVNHWEDQFCRDVYQCVFAEMQHLRATALVSPGTTPLMCPVDSIVNTHPAPPLVREVTVKTLDPCAWRYVLKQDDLASFRLKLDLMSSELGRSNPLHTTTSIVK